MEVLLLQITNHSMLVWNHDICPCCTLVFTVLLRPSFAVRTNVGGVYKDQTGWQADWLDHTSLSLIQHNTSHLTRTVHDSQLTARIHMSTAA